MLFVSFAKTNENGTTHSVHHTHTLSCNTYTHARTVKQQRRIEGSAVFSSSPKVKCAVAPAAIRSSHTKEQENEINKNIEKSGLKTTTNT